MDSTSHSLTFKATAGCLVVAVVLAVLPESAVSSLRDLVRAALVPGQRVAQRGSGWLGTQARSLISTELAAREREIKQLRAELVATNLAARRAQLQTKSLQSEIDSLHRNGPSPFARRRFRHSFASGQSKLACWE